MHKWFLAEDRLPERSGLYITAYRGCLKIAEYSAKEKGWFVKPMGLRLSEPVDYWTYFWLPPGGEAQREKQATSTSEKEDEMLVINGRTFSNYAKSVLLDTIEKQMIDHIKEISDFKADDVFFENLESLTMVLSELAVMHRVIDGSCDEMPKAALKQEADH